MVEFLKCEQINKKIKNPFYLIDILVWVLQRKEPKGLLPNPSHHLLTAEQMDRFIIRNCFT